MTRTARLLRLLPTLVPVRGPVVRPAGLFARRRSGRAAVAWFVGLALAAQVGLLLAMDHAWPQLRDPEYGRRVTRLRDRLAEHPDRPLVLVVGSSRVSFGLSPAAWEEVRPNQPGRPDPLLFNLSLVGSGPVIELLALRRAYADGFRPDAVVLEYWPPFLREDGPFHEPARVDPLRLTDRDLPWVRDYFSKPDETAAKMRAARRQPLWQYRHRLLAQWAPRWQPWDKRTDMAWANLDPWGWLAGIDEPVPDPVWRPKRLAHCEKIYREQFEGYSIHPMADRAVRESVALAREHGAKVAFVYLPESSEFRGWMPPAVEKMGKDHLAGLCRELGVPLIDGRLWLEDRYLVDGFHLSRQGAGEFSRRFGPAVAATFPDLRRRP
ncbi:MAG: DUF1574 domain-containing protein [Gemmataceae bacterium]|nr:DUF1574 domain-containing protein [Gemmataceae bacterium]